MKKSKDNILKRIGLAVMAMGGYHKGSPNGDYPFQYTIANVIDARNQFGNAHALYEASKSNHYGEIEDDNEIKDAIKFETASAVLWFTFATAGFVAYNSLIAYGAASALALFGAMTVYKIYKLKGLLGGE